VRPFYQGKLDVFCAIYAVLNAFQKLGGISVWQAKALLTEILLRLPEENPQGWRACVRNETDYIWLVSELLQTYGTSMGLAWHRPWAEYDEQRNEPALHPGDIWTAMAEWVVRQPDSRTVVFRFRRYIPPRELPVVCHWTVADRFMGDTLFLFDASKEESAVHFLDRGGFAVGRTGAASGCQIVLEPAAIFLLERQTY